MSEPELAVLVDGVRRCIFLEDSRQGTDSLLPIFAVWVAAAASAGSSHELSMKGLEEPHLAGYLK